MNAGLITMDGLTTPEPAPRFARAQPARKVDGVSEDEDAQLMLAYAGGEMRAFETLYSRHRSALYRYLVRQARDGEIAQRSIPGSLEPRDRESRALRAAREIPHVPVHARAQLFHRSLSPHEGAARRHEHRRRRRRGPAAGRRRNRSPRRALERDEATRRYRAALASLPPEQRDVYLLHEESDLSLEEIARVTGVGTETAKSRLRYAVGKLKAALAVAEDVK